MTSARWRLIWISTTQVQRPRAVQLPLRRSLFRPGDQSLMNIPSNTIKAVAPTAYDTQTAHSANGPELNPMRPASPIPYASSKASPQRGRAGSTVNCTRIHPRKPSSQPRHRLDWGVAATIDARLPIPRRPGQRAVFKLGQQHTEVVATGDIPVRSVERSSSRSTNTDSPYCSVVRPPAESGSQALAGHRHTAVPEPPSRRPESMATRDSAGVAPTETLLDFATTNRRRVGVLRTTLRG